MRYSTEMYIIVISIALIPMLIISSIAVFYANNKLLDTVRGLERHQVNNKKSEYQCYVEDRADMFKNSIEKKSEFIENISSLVVGIYNGRINISEKETDLIIPWNGTAYPRPQDVPELSDDITFAWKVGALISGFNITEIGCSLLYFTTPNGVSALDDPGKVEQMEEEPGLDARKRPWFQQAVNSTEVVWTTPYIDAYTKKLVGTCSLKVQSNGTFIGVLSMDLPLDILIPYEGIDNWGQYSFFFLTTPTGDIIQSSKDNMEPWMKKLSLTENLLDTDIIDHKTAEGITAPYSDAHITDIDGEHVYLVHIYIPSTGWIFCGGIKYSHIKESAERSMIISNEDIVHIERIEYAVSFILFVLILFVSYIAVNRIAKPIEELADTAEMMAEGNEESNIAENASGDILRLQVALNKMHAQVRAALYFLEGEENRGKK